MGASSSTPIHALPSAGSSGLQNAELLLLEAFAAATPERRVELLTKLGPGTAQHGEMLTVLCEQLNYPKDLEDQLHKVSRSYGEDERYWPDYVKRYLFRKRLKQLDPSVLTLPTTEAESKGEAEERGKLLQTLREELGLTSFYHSKQSVPSARVQEASGGDDASASEVTGASGSSTPAEAPNAWVKGEDVATAALMAAAIKRGVEDAKYYDGVPRWMEHIKVAPCFGHEHRAVVKAAQASDKAAYAYLQGVCSAGAFPDVECLPQLIKACMGSSWVAEHHGKRCIPDLLFARLTLAQLRAAKGFFASWGEDVEELWLQQIISRLAPPAGVDLRLDMAALAAYCDEVWAVLDKTSAAANTANTLRVVVAYHRLRVAYLAGGEHSWASDAARAALLDFLKVPLRGVPWEKSDAKGFFSSMSTEWWLRHAGYAHSLEHSATCLALPNVTHEELVATITAAFTELLGGDRTAKPVTKAGADGHNLSPYDKWCSATWLTGLQARAQILSGGVDPLKWEAQLMHAAHTSLATLREQSYLRFAEGNREFFASDAGVAVSFEVKAIPRVSVRVYELATTAYYSERLAEIPTDMQLDGLQPFESSELDLEAQARAIPGGAWSPFTSTRVKLPLASLAAAAGGARRGVFVVELTGGGSSCRALVRKGCLRIVERRSVGGHVLTVLDENNAPLPPARVSVTLNGRKYTPFGAEAGAPAAAAATFPGGRSPTDILIPYAARGGNYPLLLTLAAAEDEGAAVAAAGAAAGAAPAPSSEVLGWSFSTLLPSWEHAAESYTLEASFALDRESLVKDNYTAQLLVRPRLLLHGAIPAPMATLVNTSLQLTSTDAEGNNSTKLVRPFALSSDAESTVSFAVPPGLRRLHAVLSGEYEVVADGSKVTVSAQHEVALNGIDGTDHTRGVFLRRLADGTYALYCLGKTGEPVPDQSLNLRLVHSVLRSDTTMSRATDKWGAVYLGPLHGYQRVEVGGINLTGQRTGPTGSATFELPQDTATFPSVIHTSTAGDGGAFAATAGAGAGSGRAGPAALQAALPFRPPLVDDKDRPVDKAAFRLTRRDVRLVELRPRPCGSGSVQLGSGEGAGGRFSRGVGEEVVIADLLNEAAGGPESHLSYDPSLGYLLVHGLPAGEFELTVKRPYPGATQPPAPIRIRVLPAPGSRPAAAASVGKAAAGAGASSAAAAASAAPASTQLVGGFLASGNAGLQVLAAPSTGAAASVPGAITPACSLQIASMAVEDAAAGGAGAGARELVVRVCGGASGPGPARGRDVRLHVTATYFCPSWEAGASLAKGLSVPGLASTRWGPVRSRYLASRTLAEETKYVLDRQAALKSDTPPLPGNLLPRPSLLLNPWSLGPAETATQTAQGGTEYSRHADGAGGAARAGYAQRYDRAQDASASDYARHACYDFLARPSVVLVNQRLTAGEFRLPLAQLALAGAADAPPAHWDLFVTVVAVDSLSTAATHSAVSLRETAEALRIKAASPATALAGPALPFRDLTRTGATIPLHTHVVHSSRVRTVDAASGPLDITTGGAFVKVEGFGSLDRVFALYSALCAGTGAAAELGRTWSWLLQWPALSVAEQRARYSKHACTELHLFLFFKDQAFFTSVVRPFLACKRAKTFVDRWLLAEDLTAFAAPAAFARLNTFEQALLAARVGPECHPEGIAPFVSDAVEVDPTPLSSRDAIFKAALASDGLGAAPPQPMATLPPPAPPSAAMPCPAPMAMPCAPAPPPPALGGGASGARMLMSRSAAAPVAQGLSRRSSPVSEKKRKEVARVVEEEEECDDAVFGDAEEECEAPSMSMLCADEAPAAGGVFDAFAAGDMELRAAARNRVGFRPLDKTEEYAEAHYLQVRSADTTPDLVTPNEFWGDFAAYCTRIGAAARAAAAAAAPDARGVDHVAAAIAAQPFVSAELGVVASQATMYHARQLNRLLLALSVLGLPFEASPTSPPSRPDVALLSGGGGIRYASTGSPVVVFHQNLSPAHPVTSTTILCGQQFFDPFDRYATERGVRSEKFLQPTATVPPTTGGGAAGAAAAGAPGLPAVEMLVGKVYGCSVTCTNVSSQSQQLEVLLTIPRGSLPASNGFYSRTELVDLSPFSTRRIEFSFYFPRRGAFGQYPAHVGSDGELLAHASPQFVSVVQRITAAPDTADWAYVSSEGTTHAVVEYLGRANLYGTDLSRILWRCKDDAEAWRAITAALRARQHFDESVWQYGLLHGDVAAIKEYLNRDGPLRRLRASPRLLGPANPVFNSHLISLRGEEGVGATSEEVADDLPIFGNALRSSVSASSSAAVAYEHLEYSPLVNARAHVLGKARKILNKAAERQYRCLLNVLACKPAGHITAADRLAVVYHLLLQDRVAEARALFATVPAPAGSVLAAAAAGSGAGGPATGSSGSSWMVLQHDYMAAYLDLFSYDPLHHTAPAAGAAARFPVAAAVAAAHAAHPVPKWAAKFAEVASVLEEAETSAAAASRAAATAAVGSGVSAEETGTSKELSRESQAAKAAAREPQLELRSIEEGVVTIAYANLTSVALRLYRMDLELLFSSEPFTAAASASVSGSGVTGVASTDSSAAGRGGGGSSSGDALGQFAFVRPNGGVSVALPPLAPGKVGEHRIPLPAEFAASNCMVEVVAPDTALRRCQAWFANSLNVAVSEPFGRLQVCHRRTGVPLARVYVKVYYRTGPGAKGVFYKDGYTTAAGAFDYASISTDELASTQRFAIFIASQKHGSVVLTAAPPRA